MPKPKRSSEFEKKGPYPFGGDGTVYAKEKLALIKRTEQDPESSTINLKAKADQFEKGGVPRDTDPFDWSLFVE